MPSPQNFAGTQLAISWLNALLFMLELTLAIYYFSRFPTKPLFRRSLKGVLVAESICMLAMFAGTWEVLLSVFKATEFFSENPTNDWRWSIPLASFMVMVVAIFEELFLIDRCRRLSQPKYIIIPLLALVVAHAVLNLYSIIYVLKSPLIDPYEKRYGTTAAAVTACLAATVDTFIPMALSWQLYRVTPEQISRQRSWLDTMINMISSGGLGGLMSLVQLIVFWVRPDVFFMLVNTMGRIYGITLFVNLLVSRRRAMSYHYGSPTESFQFKQRKKTMSGGISLVSVSVSIKSPGGAIDKNLPPTPAAEEHPDLDTQSEAPLHPEKSSV
ncbi:hypothetical protein BJ165DRAFT_1524371 [Panaeolus papilionaceus]|nr:hypothetical protein BJ165DRAFT_1524371 [Panaeolus papilionaceus]